MPLYGAETWILVCKKTNQLDAVKHGLGGECKSESRDMLSNEIKLEKTQERRQFFKCIKERKANQLEHILG